jgi:serine/threonine protein kinase
LEVIGRYQIKEKIGGGGMAVVYLAYDPVFEREVAIKVITPQFTNEPNFRKRFEREARTIAALEHSAIVPVYDYGEHEGQPYLVMRYMAGGSLKDLLDRGALGFAKAVEITSRLAPALDKAHAAGVVHRDLKPANILFDQEGNAYISDFGIAKIAQDVSTSLTGSSLVGTPAYMSPEQARGDKQIDGRSDVYALGAILYQMLTGELPYQADTPVQLAVKHVLDPVPHILEINPSLPRGCDRVINRAMAKEKDSRYASVAELSDDLLSVMMSVQSTLDAFPRVGRSPRIEFPKGEKDNEALLPAKNPKKLVWFAGIAVLFLVIGIFIAIWLYRMRKVAIIENLPTASVASAFISTPILEEPLWTSTSTSAKTTSPTPSKTLTSLKSTEPTVRAVTFTPAAQKPYLTLDKNYHCRGGPGASYPILRDFQTGMTLEIVGKDQASEWFLVRINDTSTRKKLCWLSGGKYPGNVNDLPVCTWTGDGYTENQRCD